MRKRFVLSLFAALLLPVVALGQSVKLPAKLTGTPGIPLPIIAETDGGNVVWLTPDKGLAIIDGSFFGGDSKKAMLFAATGEYRLWAVTAKGDRVSPLAECLVTFGAPTPPAPPTPPTPPDPPKPPVPVPVGPLRVLIVFETAELPKMPAAQKELLYDPKVRGVLNDRTDKNGPNSRGWNIFDKDQDVSGMAKFWQDAMKRPRGAVPFVHLFKGDVPFLEQPLPATADELINLITKNAGG